MTKSAASRPPSDASGRSPDIRALPASETHPPSFVTAAQALAAIALGYAIQINNGMYDSEAMVWLTVALLALILATARPRIPGLEWLSVRAILFILGAGTAWQVAKLLTALPGFYLIPGPSGMAPFATGVAFAAVLAGAGLAGKPWLGRARFPILVVVFLFLGRWMIVTSPNPLIDVHVWQHEAIRALLHRINPYAITMPNIYGHALFYSPGMVVDGRVQIGYPYPPLTLFLSTIGYFFGDHRYTELAAMAIAAALMVLGRPGRLSAIVAAVFLLTPRIFFVLEQGWTDPLPVAMLCLVVYCAFRRSELLPYACGLFFATKQYLILAAPLIVLLLPRPFSWRAALQFLLKVGIAAAVVTLPLMLLNVRAFFHDLVEFQALQPLRQDSLSYLSIMAGRGMSPPQWLCFVIAFAALAFCIWRAPRTPAGFAGSVALVFGAFFAFGKQAFCNYYFFVVGAICCAVAASAEATNDASAGAKADSAARTGPS